jgi:hypothetical protein
MIARKRAPIPFLQVGRRHQHSAVIVADLDCRVEDLDAGGNCAPFHVCVFPVRRHKSLTKQADALDDFAA